MSADPLGILDARPPGSAVYARVQVDQDRWETVWLAREETARIHSLGSRPEVEFRAGLIVESGVGLVPILVRVGTGEESIYETWLNVYQSPQGTFEYLEDLLNQDRVLIILYGDRMERERTLAVPNRTLRDFATRALPLLRKLEPWTMHSFDRARERIYQKYPTVPDLWNSLVTEIGEYR